MEIRKAFMHDGWTWSCDVCHYGDILPREDVDSWAEALSAVWSHIAEHKRVGMHSTWKRVRISREQPC